MAGNDKIHAVPTNIITGFLGVGKTTAILHLLQTKPTNERWAVLVNEFGEIGIDGSLLSGKHNKESGVFIREVPGGCMCCTAGLPMSIALNQLLHRARPDRLLIEPTGLGHPKEVLDTLSAEHYKDVLQLQNVVTLVDARNLTDPRYTAHETFNQQIAIANIIVGNKADLYNEEDKTALKAYVEKKAGADIDIVFTQNAKLETALLTVQSNKKTDNVERCSDKPHNLDHSHHQTHDHSHNHKHPTDNTPATPFSELDIPDCGYVKAKNSGEGYHSVGWRFAEDRVFEYNKLKDTLSDISVERLKAIFITDKGIFGYNLASDKLTETALDFCVESRVEIIYKDDEENPDTKPPSVAHWEARLLASIL